MRGAGGSEQAAQRPAAGVQGDRRDSRLFRAQAGQCVPGADFDEKLILSNTGALEYLAARKRSDGSYNYAAGIHQTPAWVTSQVLPAINGKAYPIG